MDLKKTMNLDYIGAWDFQDGEQKVLTIKNVVEKEVFNPNKNRDELSVIIYFSNHNCGMFLNTTNKKKLIKLFGTSETSEFSGKNITLITKKIKVKKEIIDAVRIVDTLPTQPANKPPTKVDMNDKHKGWEPMIEAVKTGTYTAVKLRESYNIDDATFKTIESHEPKV